MSRSVQHQSGGRARKSFTVVQTASSIILLLLLLLLFGAQHARASTEEERLVKNLFKGYNKLIRPVRNASDYVVVTLDLFLLQLINVYEKEQIMKTNVWLTLKWQDFQLGWSSKDYKVGSIRVPYDRVWTPDIVLFNNADGNYETSYKPNVLLYADVDEKDQNINWIPPAIYQSSCTIDVRYFPFDEQSCQMRFGSWTFDAQQVRLKREKPMVNLQDYLPSGTWDVIDAPGEETYSKETNRMELVYHFRIRRKTLFYTVNLIIPTVLISFLSIFVFYLPTDEGEKMTLCISILLALVVFLLLVSKILPPTSMVIPLISKFLIFTLMMNIVTILNTVIIINWNYRTPRTHNMPKWVKLVFIETLPKLLCMKRPDPERKAKKHKNRSVREFKYEFPIAATAGVVDGGESGGGGGGGAASSKSLARNLSLELNENYPLGLKSPPNKEGGGGGGGGGDANVNVDFIGAKAKINRQSSFNRTNTLDKSNPEGCSNFLSSSNTTNTNDHHHYHHHQQQQQQQHQTRPKQQQHKNLDKLFSQQQQQQAMRSPLLSQLNNNNSNNGLTSQQRKQRHFASMEQRNATTSRDCSLDENDYRTGSNRNRLMTLSGSESIGSNSQQQRYSSLRSTSQMNPNAKHQQHHHTHNMPTSPDKHNHSDGGGGGGGYMYGDPLRPGLTHRNVAGGGGGGGDGVDGGGSRHRRHHHRHHHHHHNNNNNNNNNQNNLQQQAYYGLSHSLDYDTTATAGHTTSEDEQHRKQPLRFDSDILDAAEKITYITNHIKNENDYEEIRDDWKYVALVIDRLQLYIFFSVTVIGTAYILFDAPHIFQFVDQQKVLRELIENNKF